MRHTVTTVTVTVTTILLLLVTTLTLTPLPLSAQQPVNQSDGPPSGPPMQTVPVYSGSTVIALCWSPSSPTNGGQLIAADGKTRATRTISISAATAANPTVLTSTAHGFTLTTRPTVTISGGTGNWTPINGTFVATVVNTNTFSIPIDASTFGALTGTIIFTTTAPRQTVGEWSVQMLNYTSTLLTVKGWLGGSQSFQQKCTDAVTTTVSVQ